MTSAVFAQVKGVVLDADSGEPLVGASILVKGTSVGTLTDLDGAFTIKAASGDVLEISYTGYETQQVTLGQETSLTIRLTEGITIDEIIVTGYAVETKRQTTGAVSIVPARELSAIPSGNVEQQLQGRVA